jgi:AraC-like DNA-binding protein
MSRKTEPQAQEASTSLDEWRASIARSFVPMEVLPDPHHTGEFHAVVDRMRVGFISLSRVVSDAHVALRTTQNIAKHPADAYKVSFQVEGDCWIEQDGRRALLEPGSLAIYDTGRPYSLEFAGRSASIIALLPRAELPLDSAQVASVSAKNLTARPVLGDTLSALLTRTLSGEMQSGPTGDYHLSRAIAELIAAIVTAENLAHAPSDSAREAQLASLKLYALAHLSNPELTIDDAAAANYVSTRTTQRLFNSEGTTFATWLRSERLARAHHRLVTSADAITDIAHECGFASATHFSRAFREQYGASARETRRIMDATAQNSIAG